MPLEQELFIAQHQLMPLHASYGTTYHMMAAYNLNVAIDPLKNALMCQVGLYLLLGFTYHRMEAAVAVIVAAVIAAAVVDCYVFVTPSLDFDGAGCRWRHP